MFSWNAFIYPLMLAGRQTFPVTVGAIQLISYEQVLWGLMAAASLVAIVPQFLLSLSVQKYIARGLTMGAVRDDGSRGHLAGRPGAACATVGTPRRNHSARAEERGEWERHGRSC